jgi:hypothetical protein
MNDDLPWYIWRDGQAVRTDDAEEWGHADREAGRVGATELRSDGSVRHHVDPTARHYIFISTVFLGYDYGWPWSTDGKPVLWETLVFTTKSHALDNSMRRYTSREAAERGHAAMVARFQTAMRTCHTKAQMQVWWDSLADDLEDDE